MIENQGSNPSLSKESLIDELDKANQKRKIIFAVLLLVIEVTIIVMYGLFVRPDAAAT